MEDIKMTKKDYFARLAEVVEGAGVEDATALVEFIDAEVALIERKAAKAKVAAEKKKAEGDILKANVLACLTDELTTADDITVKVNDGAEQAESVARVRARLSALVREGAAVKETVKVEGAKGGKMAYKLA